MTLYVTTTDRFTSRLLHRKTVNKNKLIFICETAEEAEIVYKNASNRKDQSYVNLCTNRPRYYRSTFGSAYYLGDKYIQIKTKDDYPNWYKENYFKS